MNIVFAFYCFLFLLFTTFCLSETRKSAVVEEVFLSLRSKLSSDKNETLQKQDETRPQRECSCEDIEELHRSVRSTKGKKTQNLKK